MARFLLDNVDKTAITVDKTTQSWLVDFDLPEAVKETMTWDAVIAIHGCYMMAFYDAPLVGDRVEYKGHQWRIVERIYYPTRHRNRTEIKKVPLLKVEYLGSVEASSNG